ncbi:hypothetical protein V8E36_002398 [Tilletia maclaganii]
MESADASFDRAAATAPPSPEITTKQILGASSSGWSPQRQVNRKFVPLKSNSNSNSSNTTPNGQTDLGIPRKSMAVLKSHSLVSNSVFRQGGQFDGASTSTPSPLSPSKRMGVGLGIGVQQGTPARGSTITPRLGPAFTPRKLSGERVGSGSHTVDAENQAPTGADVFNSRTAVGTSSLSHARMSKGIDVLSKASFVSNSPFKQAASPDASERPLQPRNAWAMMAEAQAARHSPGSETGKPTRPLSFQLPGTGATLQGRMYQSPEMLEDHNSTPRSSAHHAKSASVDVKEPASRGLLVSNRLHGPRQMSTSASTQSDADPRSERRKTVTFDEILEVQEFDKESSFDRESTRSEGSGLSQESGTPLSDSGQWPSQSSGERLQIVNGPVAGSPSSSVSEDLPALMPSSDSVSSESSTFEETPQLQQQQMGQHDSYQAQIFQHDDPLAPQYHDDYQSQDYLAPKNVAIGDESFNSVTTGLHRVDSLVDELLSNDILGGISPALEQVEEPRRRTYRSSSVSQAQPHIAPATTPAPVARALPLRPAGANAQLSVCGLPDLPNWSPFVMPEGAVSDSELITSPTTAQEEDPRSTSSPSRATGGGRPRITRDAVLERVRAAKQEEFGAQSGARAEFQHGPVPASHSHTAALVDADSLTRSQPISRTSSTPLHARNGSTERPAPPAATPSYEARAAPVPSPVRHGVRDESPLDRLSATAAVEHDNVRRGSRDDGADFLQAPSQLSASAGPSSGRASPSSMLSSPPPPVTPAEQADRIIARRRSKNGVGRRKRSLSVGDAAASMARQARAELAVEAEQDAGGDDSFFERHRLTAEEEMESRESIGADLAVSKAMLDQSLKTGLNVPFTTGMERELNRIYKDTEAKYNTIDRGVIKGMDDKVQTTSAGDIDTGKAWRKLRRPSDMNEYAQELREIRESNTGKKPLGKIFVLVDSFIPVQLPVPHRPTRFYCVLDNGLHMVKTGLSGLRPGGQPSPIGQEFELIQHKNLEFSFTLVAVRDPHLVEPARAPPPTASPRKQKSSPSIAKGVSRLFGSPKKQAAKVLAEPGYASSSPASAPQEPMLAYMNREGAFGRTRILFEELQDRCLGTCATFDCAVMGVAEPVGSISAASRLATLSSYSAAFEQNLNKIRGKLRLKIFYLPPIPNIPRNLLPDSLAECVQGMQAISNQRTDVWMKGTLTQNGGDCSSWRRRPIQAQGSSLICFNEVTKRPIVKIDLSKAVEIEDNFDPVDATLVSPGGTSGGPGKRMQRTMSTYSTAAYEDLDENYHVERSFRITFQNGERISFFADTDEEKDKWLTALRDVVGKPSAVAPLWAHAANDMLRRIADGTYTKPAAAGRESGPPPAPHVEPQGNSRQSSSASSRPSQLHHQGEAAIPEERAQSPRRAKAQSPSRETWQMGAVPMQRAATEQVQAQAGRVQPEHRPQIPPRSFTQQQPLQHHAQQQQHHAAATSAAAHPQHVRIQAVDHAYSQMSTPEKHRVAMNSANTTPTRARPNPAQVQVQVQAQQQQAPSSAGRGRGATSGAIPRRPVPMQ